MFNFKLLGFFYLFFIVSLFLYSFTQVDLNLTLSRASIWQAVEKSFQHIGYFDRPLSTALYITIITGLFVLYGFILYGVKQNKITKKQVWTLIISTSILLAFSYNAFSYDLFNYIFDARIVTKYNENPYEHSALDYQSDPMLNFMRWTHRSYPYGPFWLVLTLPLSFIGLQYFLPTFFLFKFLITASFLGSVYYIGKILRKIDPRKQLLGIVFFGLNPFVLIESVVSAHNDIVMMFFALLAIYWLLGKKYIRAFFIFIVSIGVKFATIFLLPVFLIIGYVLNSKRTFQWNKIHLLSTTVMFVALILAIQRTQFQPWYLLFILPFMSFVLDKYYVIIPGIVLTFFASLYYIPFLYTGNWNPPIPTILSSLMYFSVIFSLILILVWRLVFPKKVS